MPTCAAACSAGAFQMTARAPRNRPVTRTQLDFHGTFSGEALRAALSLPANLPIAGQTDWHGVLKMAPDPARERSLRITSNLVRARAQASRTAGEARRALVAVFGRDSVAAERRCAGASGVGIGVAQRADSMPRDGEARPGRRCFRLGRAGLQRHADRQCRRHDRDARPGRLAQARRVPRKARSRSRIICIPRSSKWRGSTISACRFRTSRSLSPTTTAAGASR